MSPNPATPQVSYLVIAFVRSQLEDVVSPFGFGTLLSGTAANYSFQPFALSSSATPPSLFLGRYDRQSLMSSGVVPTPLSYPIAVVSTFKDDSTGKEAMKVTPSTFSGSVLVAVDFHIAYPAGSLPPDGEAGFHAIEEAFIGCFCAQETYSLIPQGVLFNNEVMVEQLNMEWNQDRWVQHIACGLNFNVIQ